MALPAVFGAVELPLPLLPPPLPPPLPPLLRLTAATAATCSGMHDRAAPVVTAARAAFDNWAVDQAATAEQEATKLFRMGEKAAAVEVLTNLAVTTSGRATVRWTALWQHLMVSFSDGMTATIDPASKICGCHKQGTVFSDLWGGKIVADTGDHYRLPGTGCESIDIDGKCHKKPPAGAKAAAAVVPKEQVHGVAQ